MKNQSYVYGGTASRPSSAATAVAAVVGAIGHRGNEINLITGNPEGGGDHGDIKNNHTENTPGGEETDQTLHCTSSYVNRKKNSEARLLKLFVIFESQVQV